MRRALLFFAVLLFCHLSVWSIGYTSINVDYATISAMGAAYATEAKMEQGATTGTDSILSHYNEAALASVGIYDAEKKRFDALRSSKLFDSSEFAYYVRIRHLVANLIMPKILVVAYGMIQRPQNVLYWGPCLYETTQEVENLCKQFQFIVTNGKLDFKDVQFLVINKQLRNLFDLSKAADVNWEEKFGNLAKIAGSLSWDDIKEDFENIEQTVLSIAGGYVDDKFADASNIGRVFHASREQVNDLYSSFKDVYDKFKNVAQAERELMSVIGTKDVEGLSRLFEVSDYNISSYMSSYLKDLQDQYYKQTWTIKKVTSGTANIYQDEIPNFVQMNGGSPDWWHDRYNGEYQKWGIMYKVKDNNWISSDDNTHYKLTSSDKNQLKQMALSRAGWSQQQVNQYSQSHPGHSIKISYTESHQDSYEWKKGRKKTHCFHAYAIDMKDVWDVAEDIYEETFDSQTMDLETFKKKLEVRLKEYQQEASDFNNTPDNNRTDKDKGLTIKYELVHGDAKYYSVSDSKKIKGSTSVTFLSKCDGGQNLGDGSFNWKVNEKHGGSLEWPKSKDLAMESNVDYSKNDEELAKFSQKEKELDDQISTLEQDIKLLDNKMKVLSRYITMASMTGNDEKVKEFKAQYKSLQKEQEEKKAELSEAQQTKEDLASAKQEFYKDMESDSEQDKTRIPSNMAMFQSLYQIEWTDDGEWVQGNEYVFTRHGYSNSGKFQVTYTAKLSLARKEKHFLGIRIHRAILSVDYALTSEYSSESVIETMQLDKNKSDEENAKLVNQRQQELMKDLEDCVVDIKYNTMSDVGEEEEPEDGIHLLYATERLEIASQIEDRLADIYSNLQKIEKMLYVRNTIKNFLTGIIRDYVDCTRRKTVIQQCLYDWRDNARNAKEISDSLRNDTAKVSRSRVSLSKTKNI